MRRLAMPLIVAVVLVAALAAGVAIGRPAQQDVIVPGGPVGGMAQLYRDFGDYQAQVVSLAPFDDQTGGAVVMDVVHHEVHEGEMWHGERTATDVANGAAVDLLLHVGGAYEAHTVFEVLASGQVTVSLWESPTVGANGTQMVAYNMRRSITETSHSQIYHTPTISATGSVALVDGRLLPGGTSPQTRVGGGIRQGIEWILAPGQFYLLRVRNSSGSAVTINTVVEWYEEASE